MDLYFLTERNVHSLFFLTDKKQVIEQYPQLIK